MHLLVLSPTNYYTPFLLVGDNTNKGKDYECFNQKNELLNTGSVTLVFIDKIKNKPITPPDWFMKGFLEKFES